MVNKVELSGCIGGRPSVDWNAGVLRLVILHGESFQVRCHIAMPDEDLAVAFSSVAGGDTITAVGSLSGGINGSFIVAHKIVTSGYTYEKHT
jgi:hypothetical protein